MKTVTRDEAIDALRERLVGLVDDERSICTQACRLGVFCRGFARYDDDELRARFPQIVRTRPRASRAELEELADRWQLARQFATDEPLACDVQRDESHYPNCRGWNEFDDRELARVHRELCGEEVRIE